MFLCKHVIGHICSPSPSRAIRINLVVHPWMVFAATAGVNLGSFGRVPMCCAAAENLRPGIWMNPVRGRNVLAEWVLQGPRDAAKGRREEREKSKMTCVSKSGGGGPRRRRVLAAYTAVNPLASILSLLPPSESTIRQLCRCRRLEPHKYERG